MRENLLGLLEKRSNAESKQQVTRTESPEEMRVRIEKEIRAELEKEYSSKRNQQVDSQATTSYVPIRRNDLGIRGRVRKWGIAFDGGKGILDFIERIEEMSLSY